MVYDTALLQGIQRERAGNYSCSAANSIGRNTSHQLVLDVKCKFLSSLSREKQKSESETHAKEINLKW